VITGLAEEDSIVESFKSFAGFSTKQEKDSTSDK
jgi:hypothetical protein